TNSSSTTPTTAPCGDTPGTPVKQKKTSKRAWSEPLPVQSVHQTVLGDRKRFPRGQCCALQCTEKFNTGNGAGAGAAVIGFSYNGEFLRREQDEFRQFGTEDARKAWVMKHVPVARLSKGSMMAAGSPVCSFAFMKFFGVTSTLVSSCKGTPKARASPFATRTVVTETQDHDKEDSVVTFLEHIQNTRGQSMPNSPDTYLYIQNKKNLYHEYCRYYNNGRVSVRDVAVGVDVNLCSDGYFYKTWAKKYPNLKLRADGDFMKCQLCTLFKGEIYGGGASGVTGVQDQAQMDLKRAQYEKHLKDVELDRDMIAKLKA
ncbi:unnamed protein product, partial [Ectocarpus sp. 12 AP-2014]